MDAMDNGLFAFRKYGYFVVDLFNGHRTHAGLDGRLPNPGGRHARDKLRFVSVAEALSRALPDADCRVIL